MKEYSEYGGTIYRDGHVVEDSAEIAEALAQLEPAVVPAGVLLDEVCPEGHHGILDGYFARAPLDHQYAYCPQCGTYYLTSRLTLAPLTLRRRVKEVA